MITHLNIHVFGRVQGVSFRYHTLEQAQALGVLGFVCNRPDGSVYLEAEGSPEVLQKLIEWCHQGPRFAKVERVEFQEGPLQNFSHFQIQS